MQKRIAIWRIVWSAIGVGLIAATALSWLECRRLDCILKDAMEARPLVTTVDLSQRGVLTAQLTQTYSGSCQEGLYLDLAEAGVTPRSPAELLKGLRGKVTVSDLDGNTVMSKEITEEWDSEYSNEKAILLMYLPPVEQGDYTVALDITSGATALRGTKQEVFVKYLFCGIEHFPVAVMRLLTWGLAITALIISVVLAIRFMKYGLWHKVE